MSATEHDVASLGDDPAAPATFMKRGTEKLQGKFRVEMEGSAAAVQGLLQSLENERHVILVGGDTVEVALGIRQLEDDPPEARQGDFTSDELERVVREALERIYSEGLDAPEAHLEYCRRQLRAAVA